MRFSNENNSSLRSPGLPASWLCLLPTDCGSDARSESAERVFCIKMHMQGCLQHERTAAQVTPFPYHVAVISGANLCFPL